MPPRQQNSSENRKLAGLGFLWAAAACSLQLQCASVKANPSYASPPALSQPLAPARLEVKAMLTPQQKELRALISELISWRSLDKPSVVLRLGATPEQSEVLNYQRLHNLTVVQNPARHPAKFAFQAEQLVLILLSNPETLGRFSIEDMRAIVPGQPTELGSRLGKTSSVYVYPELGLSFTSRRNEPSKIQYLEVFLPQTIESYKATIYEDPSAFLPH